MGLSSVSASKAKFLFFLRRYSHRIMRSGKLQRYRIFMALLLVVILWQRSNAAVVPAGHASSDKSHIQRSKVAQHGLDWSGGEIAAAENCSAPPLSGPCQGKNLTACIHQSGARNGTNQTFLVIWNGEETPLNVTVRFLPVNITTNGIVVAKKAKVNVPAYVGGSSSIVLDGGEGDCVIDMVFPSPSPPLIPSGSDEGSSQNGLTPNTATASNVSGAAAAGKCLVPSESCRAMNLTACLRYNDNTTKETSLLVWNGGDISLTVNITLLPANITLDVVELPDQQWKTVDVTNRVGANSSILLSAGDWNCAVDMVSESSSLKQFSSYSRVMLFILVITLPVAALAYWKLRPAARRADEIRYEQLEMGMANTNAIRGRTSERAEEGWDQNWGDDDWDEGKAAKSPSSGQKGKLLVNGIKDE